MHTLLTLLPPPVLEMHDGITVVRDDLLPGGTKRRALHVFFDAHDEYVYASPVQGAAQLALAFTAREHGKRATIFCAKRKMQHSNTVRVRELGATVIEVPMGYLSHVSAKAREYCTSTGAKLLPFGLDAPEFITALADVARTLDIQPVEVWSVASSGVLTRALQLAWPEASFFGVQVGHTPAISKALIYVAPERFEQDAKFPPPFPSCSNYDAKAWHYVKQFATPGSKTLFWNVSA